MGLKFYELHEDWIKILQEAFYKSGMIGEYYTGCLEFNFNEGGIVDCYRGQRLTRYSAKKNKAWAVATGSLPPEEIKLRQAEKDNK